MSWLYLSSTMSKEAQQVTQKSQLERDLFITASRLKLRIVDYKITSIKLTTFLQRLFFAGLVIKRLFQELILNEDVQ